MIILWDWVIILLKRKINAFVGKFKDTPYMPCKLGKLNDLSKFDAEFFGFQPHRVEVMDPMARMILEKAYEAIIDSGRYYSIQIYYSKARFSMNRRSLQYILASHPRKKTHQNKYVKIAI